MATTPIDENKLKAFMGQLVSDIGARISAPLVLIGDKLGLYRAMADAGPLTAAELAERTGTDGALCPRVARQPGGGRLRDLRRRRGPLHAAARAGPGARRRGQPGLHPRRVSADRLAVCGRAEASPRRSAPATASAGTSTTIDLFRGTERFFRPGYSRTPRRAWIPALEGVEEKLETGARVADVGCGHGASTVIMAEAFPHSEFFGFDYHGRVDRARPRGGRARPASQERISFDVAAAKDFPGSDYDLVACSTACTTWATPSAPPATCTRRSPTTAPG